MTIATIERTLPDAEKHYAHYDSGLRSEVASAVDTPLAPTRSRCGQLQRPKTDTLNGPTEHSKPHHRHRLTSWYESGLGSTNKQRRNKRTSCGQRNLSRKVQQNMHMAPKWRQIPSFPLSCTRGSNHPRSKRSPIYSSIIILV